MKLLHRIRGEALLAGGTGDDARSAAGKELRQALDTAGACGEEQLALRAAVSLARLLVARGRRSEARSRIGQTREVTEGGSLRDAREADALIRDLD